MQCGRIRNDSIDSHRGGFLRVINIHDDKEVLLSGKLKRYAVPLLITPQATTIGSIWQLVPTQHTIGSRYDAPKQLAIINLLSGKNKSCLSIHVGLVFFYKMQFTNLDMHSRWNL